MLTIKPHAQAGTRVVEDVLNERYAAFARLQETPHKQSRTVLCLPCGGTPKYLPALLVKSGLREGYCEPLPIESAVPVLSQACSSHCLTVTVLRGSSISQPGALER